MTEKYYKSIIDTVSAIEVKSEAEQIAKYELIEYTDSLRQALNEIRELVNNCSDNLDDIMCYDIDKYKKIDILEIIDKYTKEDD